MDFAFYNGTGCECKESFSPGMNFESCVCGENAIIDENEHCICPENYLQDSLLINCIKCGATGSEDN